MAKVIADFGGLVLVQTEPKYKAKVVFPDGKIWTRMSEEKIQQALIRYNARSKTWRVEKCGSKVYITSYLMRMMKSKYYEHDYAIGHLFVVKVSNRAIKKASK